MRYFCQLTGVLWDRSRHVVFSHNVVRVKDGELHDVHKREQVLDDRLEMENRHKGLELQHDEVYDAALSKPSSSRLRRRSRGKYTKNNKEDIYRMVLMLPNY